MPPEVGPCRRDIHGNLSRTWTDDMREMRGNVRMLGGVMNIIGVEFCWDENDEPKNGLVFTAFPTQVEMLQTIRTSQRAEIAVESVLSDFDEILGRNLEDL